jgi:NitT/TauT family transport system substrate-binding protein
MITRRTFVTAAGALLAMPAIARWGVGRALAAAPIRVDIIPVLGAAPAIVMNGEGWGKDAGLELSFVTFESGPNMIQALASGTLDVYVAGVAPLAVARAKGVDVKVVAATAIEEMSMVAGPKLAAEFKDGVSPAEALANFRKASGKPARLATQPAGSVPNTTLQHWLWEVAKAQKADAEIVPMGIDATQQALLTGAVEGATIREPAVTIVTKRDPRNRVVALGGAMFPNQPGTVVAFSGNFLSRDRAAAQAIVNGVVKAVALIKSNPDKAAPHIEAMLGKGIVDVATIKAALTSPASKFVADPDVIVDATREMQAYQVKLGSLDKEYPLEGLFDRSFYKKAVEG